MVSFAPPLPPRFFFFFFFHTFYSLFFASHQWFCIEHGVGAHTTHPFPNRHWRFVARSPIAALHPLGKRDTRAPVPCRGLISFGISGGVERRPGNQMRCSLGGGPSHAWHTLLAPRTRDKARRLFPLSVFQLFVLLAVSLSLCLSCTSAVCTRCQIPCMRLSFALSCMSHPAPVNSNDLACSLAS